MSIPCGDIYAPYWATYQSGAPSFATARIDAEGEQVGAVVQAPKTGTISKIHVLANSIVVAPGADYDIRLETVGTSDGLPTGTLFDTNTNGALTIIAGDDDEWLPVTLTAGASVTRGDDIFAVVYKAPASPDTGNVGWVKYSDSSYGFPYACFHNATIWSKQVGSPMVLLEYSDGSIPRIPNCFPWTQVLYLSGLYSDSSWPYTGNRFKLRQATEIAGVWFQGDMDADDVTATLYSGTATVEKTLTLKKHHSGGTGGNHTQYAGYFSSSFTASADTLYRLSLKNNYATASGTPLLVTRAYIQPSSMTTKVWDHMPYAGLFSEIYLTQSQDLSSWADASDFFGMIGPIIRSIG
jgi:hypothetical protein